MPDELIALCRFYADQYGMVFQTMYDPVFFIIKGHIIFKNVLKNFTIMCAGLSDKEIADYFHTIIYVVLAESALKK